MEKPLKPKSKKAETKKILLNVDHEIDDRLNLVNEILGGGGYRAGKKTAVIRTALDEFLPSKQDLIRMKKTPDRHDWIIGKLKKRYAFENFQISKRGNLSSLSVHKTTHQWLLFRWQLWLAASYWFDLNRVV